MIDWQVLLLLSSVIEQLGFLTLSCCRSATLPSLDSEVSQLSFRNRAWKCPLTVWECGKHTIWPENDHWQCETESVTNIHDLKMSADSVTQSNKQNMTWKCPLTLWHTQNMTSKCPLTVSHKQNRAIACWWAHNDSLDLYFVSNKFLFKPNRTWHESVHQHCDTNRTWPKNVCWQCDTQF